MIYEQLRQSMDERLLKKDEPLADYTSFRVGGPCDCMITPRTAEELAGALKACREKQIPFFILGNGTNVIALDEGYRGAVIHIGKDFSAIGCDGNRITAGAGALLAAVSKKAYENGLTGLEFAGGIPGSVGGGVAMNAGAYGGELKQIVTKVTSMDMDGEMHEHKGGECGFGYRKSIFQQNGQIVLKATFELQPGDPEEILAVMQDLMHRRNSKQPLNYPSAGSTFKRPEGYFAGKLIEDSGLKGVSVGGAAVSELHAGFVINKGGATASDILTLMELIQNTVYDNYHVMLQPEVRIIR
ncbi:MAG: UDP-N-acetylmuramate dehydrogenase [Firmicutes bacterium]|nr:UDP-N-acetylmuramate dehydrogenase [Bacillota bacterium]